MHAEAAQFVARHASGEPIDVVEIGSLDINGTVRHLFPYADWHGIDVVAGPGVDEVADGATWQPAGLVDLVVCCEVLEHTSSWREIVANAARMVRSGGRVILTAAGPGRAPHSAVDGGPVRDGEYYANVDPAELGEALSAAGLVGEVDEFQADVRVCAVKGEEVS